MFALLLILVTDQRKDSLGPGLQWGERQKNGVKRGKTEQKIRDRLARFARRFFLALTIFLRLFSSVRSLVPS